MSIAFRFSLLNHKSLVWKHGEENSSELLAKMMIKPWWKVIHPKQNHTQNTFPLSCQKM